MQKFFLILLFLSLINNSYCQPLSESDVNVVTKAAQGKSIVALGEPEHFYKGYYELKVQIIKHLILNNAIDVIYLEASAAECRKLDKYIKGGSNDTVASILPRLNEGYQYRKEGLFDCKEMLDFIVWLRNENKKRRNPISLYGLDFQSFETPIHELRLGFTTDKYLIRRLDTIQRQMSLLLSRFIENPISLYTDPTWKGVAAVNYNNTQAILEYVQHKSSDKWVQFDSRQLNQFAHIFTDVNLQRDSMMFENFKRLFKPGQKALIWAADFHIGNDSLVNTAGKMLTLGAYLTKWYKSQYFRIAIMERKTDNNPALIRIEYPMAKGMDDYGKYDMKIAGEKGEHATPLNLGSKVSTRKV